MSMSEQEKQDAKKYASATKKSAEKAKQSAKTSAEHAKAALKNGTGAVETVAEEVTEEAVDNVTRIHPKKVSRGLGDTGVGFLALSVCVYSGAVAYTRFRAVLKGQYVNGGTVG